MGNCFVRTVLSSETTRLKKLCEEWENKHNKIQVSNTYEIDDDFEGEISSVIGKTKILINGRFAQLETLIEEYESCKKSSYNNQKNIITYSDLEGFWDLIYLQIKDLDNKYEKLSKRL